MINVEARDRFGGDCRVTDDEGRDLTQIFAIQRVTFSVEATGIAEVRLELCEGVSLKNAELAEEALRHMADAYGFDIIKRETQS